MHNNEPITIFVAAPGDMDPEREEVARAVARLNQRLGANMVVYDPDKLLYQCDEDFQSQISQEGVALVLTLLWYRVGTPLGEAFARADGSRPTGTQFEYENAKALKQQTGKPDMLVYRKMADVPAKHAGELVEFNRFWAEHFRNGDSFSGSFKEFMTTTEFAQLIEVEIETWYRKTYQKPYWLEDSPYRGLQAFEPRHASIFFGREDNIRALSTRLISKTENNRFMLVLGASGSGKSSLIQAGLIPTLQAQGLIFGHMLCSPSQLIEKPLLVLAQKLFAALPSLAQGDLPTPELLAATPAMFGLAIKGAITRQQGNKSTSKLLLLFDQFEELFSWPKAQQSELIAVLQNLADVEYLYVIGCLRADYYNRWLDDQQLVQLSNGNDNQYALPSIHGYQLKAIIESPAQAAGLTFETHDKGENLAEVLLTDAEGESNSLPLLQFTLEKLYLAKQGNILTFAAYQQLGGITKAISKTAEQLLATLPYGDSLFKAVISTLVAIDEEGNKSRQSALLASFDTEQRKLVAALIKARLLVAEQDKVRLTHDKLLEHWQSLNDWYHEDLDFRRWLARISKEAILWQQHKRAKDYLLPAGKKLLEAQGFVKSHQQAIVSEATAHTIQANIDEFVQHSSRLNRNKAWLRGGLVSVVMVVLLGMTVYSLQQQELALAQQKIAEQQKAQAQIQQQKAEDLLSQARKTLTFMNYDLRDALQQYAPVRVRAKITEQIDTLLTALQQHAPNDDRFRYDQAAALMQKADVLLENSNADPAGALALYQQAYQIKQDLMAQNPDDSFYQRSLAVSHDTLGDNYLRLGDTSKALAAYQSALAIDKKLSLQDGSNMEFKRDLSVSHSKLGDIYLRLGDTDKALEAYQTALAIRKKLSLQDDSNTQFKRDLSISLSNMGDIYLRLGDTAKALEAYQAALAIDKKLSLQDDSNTQFKRDLSVSHNKLGDIYLHLGDVDKALEAYQAALVIRKKLSFQDDSNTEFKRDLSVSLAKMGDINLRLGDTDKALEAYQAVLAIHEKLSVQDDSNSEFKRDLSVSHSKLGDIYLRLGDTDKTLEAYQAALAIDKKLSLQDDSNSEFKRDLAVSHDKLGNIYLRQGNIDKALEAYQAALAIRKKLSLQDDSNTQFKRDLAVSFIKMFSINLELNNQTEALTYIAQAYDIFAAMDAKGVLAVDDKKLLQALKKAIEEMKK